ncbi:4-demethylwyosine synthase TYW1 [Candidatus Micrarchaeota archaeon]|nr:4-demethylwyosine synthase TYW1 [Candidatus Micrarchaeota archaeon]
MAKIKISDEALPRWEKSYSIIGNHSGIQICTWTKKALRGKGVCYKEKFYGVDCHRCAQISPALAWCQENCIFCWRPNEWMEEIKMKNKDVDEPAEIIEQVVAQRKKLVSGLKGAEDADKRKWDESFFLFPSHWAISLSGEPTLYPKLPEMVKELRKHKEVRSIFIVSNGQEPKMIAELAKEDALPTQLYISLDASDSKMFEKVNKPKYKDGWKRLNRTLALLPKLKCRRVIRYTLIKEVNDAEKYLEKFADIFEKSKADFIEIKGYMFLGDSRKRLVFENMPMHEYVKKYAEKIVKLLPNYRIEDEDYLSRIVLLKRKNSYYENRIKAQNRATR